MPKTQSKKTRRQNRILDALTRDPAKRVNELSAELDVSAETIRRDLAELDAEGRIKRTYGGAVRAPSLEPSLVERQKLFIAERERIASAAVGLLDGVESLYIGGGSSTLHFARALRPLERHMTILTASFEIAIHLAGNPLFEVISLPGTVELQENLVHGPETLRFIGEYNAQAAIMGASAIDGVGVTEALPSAAAVYGAMIGQSEQTIVVADRSKIGKKSLKRILRWGESTTLVTDTHPPPSIAQAMLEKGVRTEIATAEC